MMKTRLVFIMAGLVGLLLIAIVGILISAQQTPVPIPASTIKQPPIPIQVPTPMIKPEDESLTQIRIEIAQLRVDMAQKAYDEAVRELSDAQLAFTAPYGDPDYWDEYHKVYRAYCAMLNAERELKSARLNFYSLPP